MELIFGHNGAERFMVDFASARTLRLFTQPLAGEASWLLPFVLGGLVVLALTMWKKPFGPEQTAVILWAGWLLPEMAYFTYNQELMHAYYLIMMGAPIAALAAMTGWAGWQILQKHTLLGLGLLGLLSGGTLAFQAGIFSGATDLAPWVLRIGIGLFGLGLIGSTASIWKVRFRPVAAGLLFSALLVAPTAWSALTTFNPAPDGALPAAGPARSQAAGSFTGGYGPSPAMGNGLNRYLLYYLSANTPPATYLMATNSAKDAAPYILATGRPVLAFSGYLGQYEEVTGDKLAALAHAGRLRFVAGGSFLQYPDILQWVQHNCTMVDISGLLEVNGGMLGSPGWTGVDTVLFDCQK